MSSQCSILLYGWGLGAWRCLGGNAGGAVCPQTCSAFLQMLQLPVLVLNVSRRMCVDLLWRLSENVSIQVSRAVHSSGAV